MRPVLLIATLLFASAAIAAPAKRGVTLDVKDAGVHDVLKSIQKNCGIRNLIIDPGVTGSVAVHPR